MIKIKTLRTRFKTPACLIPILLSLVALNGHSAEIKTIYDNCVDIAGKKTWPDITRCGRATVKALAKSEGVQWCTVLGPLDCQLMLMAEGLARFVEDGEMGTELAVESFLRAHNNIQELKTQNAANRQYQQARPAPNWNALIELGNRIGSGQLGGSQSPPPIMAQPPNPPPIMYQPPKMRMGGMLVREYKPNDFTKVCVYGQGQMTQSLTISSYALCPLSHYF